MKRALTSSSEQSFFRYKAFKDHIIGPGHQSNSLCLHLLLPQQSDIGLHEKDYTKAS